MALDYFVQEAVNMFCGDHDPNDSKHLTISELKLPDLQKIHQDHHAGGSPFAIEVALGVQKLEPTFKLSGHDPKLLAQFGLGSGDKRIYTSYGAIRNKRTGALLKSKAIMEASLGRIAPDAFRRGDLQGHEYSLNEVTRYELYMGGDELIFWDFWSNTWRSGGVDQNGAVNRALGIA